MLHTIHSQYKIARMQAFIVREKEGKKSTVACTRGGRLQADLMRHPPPAICHNLRGGGGSWGGGGGGVGGRVEGGVLAARPGGGCARPTTTTCIPQRGCVCLGAWGYRDMYAIIAISRLCREESLGDQRHGNPLQLSMGQKVWRHWCHGPRTAIFQNSRGGGGGGAGGCRIQGPGPAAPQERAQKPPTKKLKGEAVRQTKNPRANAEGQSGKAHRSFQRGCKRTRQPSTKLGSKGAETWSLQTLRPQACVTNRCAVCTMCAGLVTFDMLVFVWGCVGLPQYRTVMVAMS